MNIELHFVETVAVLVFDRNGLGVNRLDDVTLNELSEKLDDLFSQPDITGLVIRSAKPGKFLCGADLDDFTKVSGERLERLVLVGRNVINRIADLPYPTVAAIHGECLGGGLELALACDWRIASGSVSTNFALPETKLGVFPVWGATSRLPDLLGLQEALPVILSGRFYGAAEAKRVGLIDETVPAEHLTSFALKVIGRGKRHHSHNLITHNQAVANLTKGQAQKDLLKKTRGRNPGAEAALEIAVASIGRSRAQTQQAELDAIRRVVGTADTRQLSRMYFLRRKAKAVRVDEGGLRDVRRIAVIGAGAAGAGIAHWASSEGIETALEDSDVERIANGMALISGLYKIDVRSGARTKVEARRGMDRISPMAGKVPLHRFDLIIDSRTGGQEDLRERLVDVMSRCGPDAMVAVNPTRVSLHEVAQASELSDSLVGLHFLDPVRENEIVEIVRTLTTPASCLHSAVSFIARLGKIPMVVEDSPGLMVNRILMPYLMAAADLFEQGGDPEEIDEAMMDFGMKDGPLRQLDEIGLDVALDVSRRIAAAFPSRITIPGVIGNLIGEGHKGKREGSGFYVYDSASPAVNAEAIGFQTGSEGTPADVSQRLSRIIAEEAGKCLEDGVAKRADDIDLALVLGAGYPAFRGGPLAQEGS